jgi:class 3 adenylate cyclase
VVADRFDDVTVVFVDIVCFTSLAASVTPERLVEISMVCSHSSTRSPHAWAWRKSRQSAMATMAVAGLPEPREDHAGSAAAFALAINAAISEWRCESG